MPWQVWEPPMPVEKPKPTVKLSATGIGISRAAAAAHKLDGVTHVLLHINENKTAIGISKADASDKRAMKAGNKGRSADTLFIACGRVLKDWEIQVDAKANTSDLEDIEGMAAFLLPSVAKGSTADSATEGPKKRGRKPKA